MVIEQWSLLTPGSLVTRISTDSEKQEWTRCLRNTGLQSPNIIVTPYAARGRHAALYTRGLLLEARGYREDEYDKVQRCLPAI